ncbi:hypothetical protein DAPPUDRAFT_246747 [Daphnia pulex]|uniref:Uncharacterized protein n=1 Tax=Daphnia pulex TaxID=6669 RepID=E9GR56_DAPPU|nr:hypothetical protein DAPPUDRAFT_246747 [Daphnia pulex]|eukprot:EFX78049.1 hypothetical protein DAPPUDRAFT_246747 [Daphnia pulex]
MLPDMANYSIAEIDAMSMCRKAKVFFHCDGAKAVDVALLSGSACTSALLEPSYILRTIGAEEDLAYSSIRFGIGRFTTKAEVDYTAHKCVHQVTKLREMSRRVYRVQLNEK